MLCRIIIFTFSVVFAVFHVDRLINYLHRILNISQSVKGIMNHFKTIKLNK